MQHTGHHEGKGIKHLKEEALALYGQLAMPKEKEEAWRHTNIERLSFDKFLPMGAPHILLSPLSEEAKGKGAVFCTMKEALSHHFGLFSQHYLKHVELKDKVIALNAAMWQDGVYLHVPKNVHLKEPLTSAFSSDKSAAMHNLIIIEEGSEVSYLEEYRFLGESEILVSCVTEVFAKNAARINFHHLTRSQEKATIFNHIKGDARKDARIKWAWGSFGGRINRLHIDTLFNGQGSSSENLGIIIGRKKQHLDCTTNAYHNVANTTNDMMINGIMMDSSSSIYRGLIKITKEAQGTNSYLSNHVLKLSDKALANSIPSLEIDANEVKASHGATVGQIDEEQIFYLRSRGLSLEESERLIAEGFFEPIIHKMENAGIQEKFRAAILEVV